MNATLNLAILEAAITAHKRAVNLQRLQFRQGTPPRRRVGKDRSLGNLGTPFVTAHMANRAANKGFIFRD